MVPVHALLLQELLQGNVKESRFGMGIDSVKVPLKGSASSVHSDSMGRFSFTTVSLHGRSAARPEVLWLARSRTTAWSLITGPVSIRISDAGGRMVLSHLSSGKTSAGVFSAAGSGLKPGIYFIRVRAMGSSVSWTWYAIPGMGGDRDPPRIPIRILIVDGMSNHDWKQTTKVARAIFAKAGLFSVDVSTAPAGPDSAAWKAWRPVFKDYETVVMNYNSGHTNGSLRWPRQKEMELEEYVKAGGGL